LAYWRCRAISTPTASGSKSWALKFCSSRSLNSWTKSTVWVIPGGESGTFLKLLGEAGFEKLKQFARTKPTFGTCAGAILLAAEVENPKQAGLGALDIGIRRNAYGRQIDSSIRQGKLGESAIEMVFIRAPRIERIGPGVEVIATEGNDPVAVRQGKAMAATFHPELSEDSRVHRAFLDLVGNGSGT